MDIWINWVKILEGSQVTTSKSEILIREQTVVQASSKKVINFVRISFKKQHIGRGCDC